MNDTFPSCNNIGDNFTLTMWLDRQINTTVVVSYFPSNMQFNVITSNSGNKWAYYR